MSAYDPIVHCLSLSHISVCGVKTLVPAPQVTPRSQLTLNIMDFPDTVELGIWEEAGAGGRGRFTYRRQC